MPRNEVAQVLICAFAHLAIGYHGSKSIWVTLGGYLCVTATSPIDIDKDRNPRNHWHAQSGRARLEAL